MENVSYFDIDKGKIAYQISGKGSPLILCMGYGANMDTWDLNLIEILKKNHMIIIFDYRGMGLSSYPVEAFSILDLANDVNSLCNHLNIEQANILGWSMGGYIAQLFAIYHPCKVNKLILYSSDAGGKNVINPEEYVLKTLTDPNTTSQQMAALLFPEGWFENHPEAENYFNHIRIPLKPETIKLQDKACQNWVSETGGTVNMLHKIKSTTLVITGDEDYITPSKNSEILFEKIPNAVLIKMKSGGHGLMYQYPEALANYINAFLR